MSPTSPIAKQLFQIGDKLYFVVEEQRYIDEEEVNEFTFFRIDEVTITDVQCRMTKSFLTGQEYERRYIYTWKSNSDFGVWHNDWAFKRALRTRNEAVAFAQKRLDELCDVLHLKVRSYALQLEAQLAERDGFKKDSHRNDD